MAALALSRLVMLGLNVSGNLPHKACDGGHRFIPHLSLTDKRPWSITSDYRPRDYVEQVTQVLNKSLHNNVAKTLASLTRAHALAQREHFNLDIGKITTLSKNWARSSSKLNYEHASCLTEAQAIAPSLAPNHSRAQWRNFSETVHPQYCT